MRSRLKTARPQWLLSLALLASVGMSGCQIGRTFFQMDSNSSAPFMGLDLLPRRDRTSPTAGVSRFQNETVVQPSALNTRAESTERETSRLSRLLGRSPEPKQLTLPSTTEAANLSTDAPVEDFR